LIIVTPGIWLVLSLIPDEVMAEYRAKANAAGQRPVSKDAAIVIMAIWIFGAAILGWAGFSYWRQSNQATALPFCSASPVMPTGTDIREVGQAQCPLALFWGQSYRCVGRQPAVPWRGDLR
jgi:hypothetical protein